MFNNKKIKKLEARVSELEKENRELEDIEPDFFTKNLYLKSDMVCIKGEVEKSEYIPFSSHKHSYFIDKNFYFLKGTEPKCDFIRQDLDGKVEFIKNSVVCDKNGKIK